MSLSGKLSDDVKNRLKLALTSKKASDELIDDIEEEIAAAGEGVPAMEVMLRARGGFSFGSAAIRKVTFGNAQINVDSKYNPATGIWTAPKAGKIVVKFRHCLDSPAADSNIFAFGVLQGRIVSSVLEETVVDSLPFTFPTQLGLVPFSLITQVIDVEVDDQISCFAFTNSAGGTLTADVFGSGDASLFEICYVDAA